MSVLVFDFASAASLDDPNLIRNAFALRKEQFHQRDNYETPEWQGMEFDQYDCLAATYFVRRGENGTILGFARLVPTRFHNYDHSMLKDNWSELINAEIPSGENIYEGSRFVISPHLSANPELRTRVIDELVLGIMEYCLAAKVKHVIGVMYPKVWQNVFVNRGWDVKMLCDAVSVGGENEGKTHVITAGIKEVSFEMLKRIRERTGIHEPVLEVAPNMILGSQQWSSYEERKVAKG